MRALTFSQARRCEQALAGRCKCRCRGALHGARRVDPEAQPQAYEQLPADDPHHVVSEEERRQAAEAAAVEEARQKLEAWLGRPVTAADAWAIVRGRPPQE